jgi:hypothetical protein
MNLVERTRSNCSNLQPIDHMRFEKQAKELCQMLRSATRQYYVIMEKHMEDTEEANRAVVQQLADSHRNCLDLCGRIGSISLGVLGGIALQLPVVTANVSAGTRNIMKVALDASPGLVDAGITTAKNFREAERIEMDALSKNLQQLFSKATNVNRENEEQLKLYLQALRQLNDDLARAMQAMRM